MASNGRPAPHRATDDGIIYGMYDDPTDPDYKLMAKEVHVTSVRVSVQKGPNKFRPHKNAMSLADVIKTGTIGTKDGSPAVIVHDCPDVVVRDDKKVAN